MNSQRLMVQFVLIFCFPPLLLLYFYYKGSYIQKIDTSLLDAYLKFSIALNFEEKGSFEKLLEYTIKHSLTITCDECKNNVLSSEDSIKEFKEDYLYTCSNCKNIERIGQYYISDAFLKEQLVLDASKENNMYKLKSKYKRKQSGK